MSTAATTRWVPDGHVNRLAGASSPYLRQHRDNPVDWYQWGEEAFAEAGRTDRPILLSVGYSACHWCHVMAHESFEDPATAATDLTLEAVLSADAWARARAHHRIETA